MSRRSTLVLASAACALLALTRQATADDTFADCQSAYNYGENSAWFYVDAAMSRADCNPGLLDKAEKSLARSLRRQAIPAHNPEALKACFYAGLYAGYIDALAANQSECSRSLSLASVARAAASVFQAMQVGLDWIDPCDVDQVFDGVFSSPGGGAASACESFLTDELPAAAGRAELVDSVCHND